MANQDIVDFIKRSKNEGKSVQEIKRDLVGAGWQQKDIDDAFKSTTSVPVPPGVPKPPSSDGYPTMWDAFEHTLMFISLYAMAIGISLILHNFVDRYFPEISQYVGYSNPFADFILLCAEASVIVATPLFLFFHLHVTKRTLKNPALRKLKARRVLTYITLVVTFLIMLGNVISAVYKFLSGNVTPNFLLHIAVTLLISGLIFANYLYQVKADQKVYA